MDRLKRHSSAADEAIMMIKIVIFVSLSIFAIQLGFHFSLLLIWKFMHTSIVPCLMSTKIRAILLRSACILVALMPITQKIIARAIAGSARILVALRAIVTDTIGRVIVWSKRTLVALSSTAAVIISRAIELTLVALRPIVAQFIVRVKVWSKRILVALRTIIEETIVRVIGWSSRKLVAFSKTNDASNQHQRRNFKWERGTDCLTQLLTDRPR
ncbi:uncharacterized protein LOC111347087 [Stylophora pistillata]|uniref:uncharacterized protein LOC111347087 n=1 Tax=Stylophora pistillata TaxID=50429 RepID=UPI000C04F7E4|nr:uncharacterized protein LOC111347087 [Stylophora pistillata]